jgi:hypothetical protein
MEVVSCSCFSARCYSHCPAAALDQSMAILLQSFAGIRPSPAPWSKAGGVVSSDSCLPKRLQTHNILARMNHAVEGTAASPHWLVFANAAESISSSLTAAAAAGEHLKVFCTLQAFLFQTSNRIPISQTVFLYPQEKTVNPSTSVSRLRPRCPCCPLLFPGERTAGLRH